MQFGLEVGAYKRVRKGESNKEVRIKDEPTKFILTVVCGALVGRVTLFLNRDNIWGIAPFGIAYLLAMILDRDERKILLAALGVSLGYLSIAKSLNNSLMYIIATLMIVIYSLIAIKKEARINEIYLFSGIFVSYLVFGMILSKYGFGVNITLSLVNTLLLLPIYYVIKYALNCISEFNNNYFFTSEEIISMGIFLCLVISGIGNFGIFNIQFRNIFAYLVILVISYIGGGAYGAAIGVSMGIIIGMNTGDMATSIAFYSIAGLISGVFKDTGKFFSFLSVCIMYFALSLYSQNLNISSIIEIVFAGGIYFSLPKKIFKFLEVEMNIDKKREMVNDIQLNELKSEFSNRVEGLSSSLMTVSSILENIGANEKLLYKNKSTALIENLADRVCSNCGECKRCWDRDFTLTYNSFQLLIEHSEKNKAIIPKELNKRCVKQFELLRSSEQIISNMNVNETLKKRLEDGRLFLANNIKTLSLNIDNMIDDFKRDVVIAGDTQKTLRRLFNKNSVKYKSLFCYRGENGRLKVKITMNKCEGDSYCKRSLLPMINSVVTKPLIVDKEGCRIDPKTNTCTMIFTESPKYHIVSFGAMTAKDGEEYTGDTYSFNETRDGVYLSLISDGMGSGPDAGKESKATVELVEKFLNSGFGEDIAINMVNSIMNMKFEEDEKFSTLDLNTIDLYTGDASFIKVGAVASFIKRNDKVKVINSNMPPFGLVDKVDVEGVQTKLKNGDIIITLSDGVLDVDKNNIGNSSWLKEYLKSSSKDPKRLASDILEKAKELSGGVAKDDMTVVVSKVYEVY